MSRCAPMPRRETEDARTFRILPDLSARHGSCCTQRMLKIGSIRPHMPVVCSEGGQFAEVDHMSSDNRTIKLSRDDSGKHHYIPVAWVTKIDDKVHIDRPGDQAMREWSSEAA